MLPWKQKWVHTNIPHGFIFPFYLFFAEMSRDMLSGWEFIPNKYMYELTLWMYTPSSTITYPSRFRWRSDDKHGIVYRIVVALLQDSTAFFSRNRHCDMILVWLKPDFQSPPPPFFYVRSFNLEGGGARLKVCCFLNQIITWYARFRYIYYHVWSL